MVIVTILFSMGCWTEGFSSSLLARSCPRVFAPWASPTCQQLYWCAKAEEAMGDHACKMEVTTLNNVIMEVKSIYATVFLLFRCIWLLATPWTATRQVSLSFTISQSLLKLTSIETMMPSNHLILCHPLLLLPSIFPSIRVFSSTLARNKLFKRRWSHRPWKLRKARTTGAILEAFSPNNSI